jgi:hypothetical protein
VRDPEHPELGRDRVRDASRRESARLGSPVGPAELEQLARLHAERPRMVVLVIGGTGCWSALRMLVSSAPAGRRARALAILASEFLRAKGAARARARLGVSSASTVSGDLRRGSHVR